MDILLQSVKLEIDEKLYVKDPESSDLGKKIVEQSILLIDEIGFESFTFKKLGVRIHSNESSIYRYFENKHKLLLYLASWYWGWVEYKPIKNELKNYKNAPATTELSDTISKDLKKRGFKFVGSTVIYAHMQATGMVNDHEVNCFRYHEV